MWFEDNRKSIDTFFSIVKENCSPEIYDSLDLAMDEVKENGYDFSILESVTRDKVKDPEILGELLNLLEDMIWNQEQINRHVYGMNWQDYD